jgi:hypothetical protein
VEVELDSTLGEDQSGYRFRTGPGRAALERKDCKHMVSKRCSGRRCRCQERSWKEGKK